MKSNILRFRNLSAGLAGILVRPNCLQRAVWTFAVQLIVMLAFVGGLTWAVAMMCRSTEVPTDAFAIKDVPKAIDGHEVTTDFGRQLFMRNCSSCHAADLTGMPQQGANLVRSAFVTRRSDSQLMVFLRTGRMPGDRDSVLGLTMPPRGGNPRLSDAELADIVAYLRLAQRQQALQRQNPPRLFGIAARAMR